MAAELKCEVCQHEPSSGVYPVSGAPMSVRKGQRCLFVGAEPYWAMRAVISNCVGPREAKPYLETIVYHEGKYVTIGSLLERFPLTAEELSGNGMPGV